ncbi:hypothetical protein COCON_G00005900 [Conger conger]|uniref:EF-hand domain-containing protein n=1 Tax=Conger conger TaxID=82655 RepID=A0A9Q1E1J3_CONCO|nr:hypothetical protein COCON_G00005900 [Conger conger]
MCLLIRYLLEMRVATYRQLAEDAHRLILVFLERISSFALSPYHRTLVSQFKTFAGKDGSSDTLSKEEFRSLVASQLPNFVQNSSDPAVIDQLMGSVDENNDGELTFLEFWQLIGSLANKQGGFSQ